MRYYIVDKEEVLKELNADEGGLTSSEAEQRLATYGKNKLEAAKGKSLITRFFEQIADPMIIILIVAATISGILAFIENDSFADVLIIMTVVIVNAVLGYIRKIKLRILLKHCKK